MKVFNLNSEKTIKEAKVVLLEPLLTFITLEKKALHSFSLELYFKLLKD